MWWGYNNNIIIATREPFKNTKCRAKKQFAHTGEIPLAHWPYRTTTKKTF